LRITEVRPSISFRFAFRDAGSKADGGEPCLEKPGTGLSVKGIMKRAQVLSVVVVALSIAAVGQDCTSNDFAEFSEVQGTVLRLLSWPGYTGFDEKTLNRSGDLAAVAVMRNVSVEAMDTPQNARQILLILEFAFEAPHLLTKCNRNPLQP